MSLTHRRFEKQAHTYAQAAHIQREIGNRLLERLEYLKITPRSILDLGCGPNMHTHVLHRLYPGAQIVGVDIAYNMLSLARREHAHSLIQASMDSLPFKEGSFDIIFMNQALHWSNEYKPLLHTLHTLLREEGCLLFSTLGPDTFHELSMAFSEVDNTPHTHDFLDMHHIGDMLLAEQFLDPIVDMEKITLHYPSLTHLLRALKAQGVSNHHEKRSKGLTGKHTWEKLATAYTPYLTEQGHFPLTYEVIYGQAFKGRRSKNGCHQEGTTTFIPISTIKTKKI